jgi:nucleotidyltransferase substrate binding protein (TIGR01987 family)
MEILIKRHQTLIQALKTLDEILKDLNTESPYHKAFRDSTIQRFEYCADIFWKTLKDYLILALGTSPEGSSPKKVFTACVTAQVITPEEHKICNSLVEDRNITSHSYNEDLAEEICTRIPQYYLLMQTVADRIASSIMHQG